MNFEVKNTKNHQIAELAAQAEHTLRLVAQFPAPEGIENRIHAKLKAVPRGRRVLAWPGAGIAGRRWSDSGFVRGVAAAVIVLLVGGGAWQVYSRVQSTASSAVRVLPMTPRQAAPGTFSNAGAVRSPQTLNGPVLVHPAKKKIEMYGAPSNSQDHLRKDNESGRKAAHSDDSTRQVTQAKPNAKR